MDDTTSNSVLLDASSIFALLANWLTDDVMDKATLKYGGRVELIAPFEDVVAIREKVDWLTNLPGEQLRTPRLSA